MCGAVLQQQSADGLSGWERPLETVQQHIGVDQLRAARLTRQSLQQEGLQSRAGAGQQQSAQATEVCLRETDAVVLGRLSFRLCEDLQRCVTVDAELGLCSLTAGGDKALLGEEQQLGNHLSEIAGVHVAVQRQEGLERSGLSLCCLGALLRQFLEHSPFYSSHVAPYKIQATQIMESGGAGLQQGQNAIIQLSTQML